MTHTPEPHVSHTPVSAPNSAPTAATNSGPTSAPPLAPTLACGTACDADTSGENQATRTSLVPGEVRGAPATVERWSVPRIGAWQDLQFGLFLHWGVYSMFEGRYQGVEQTTGYPEQIKAWMNITDEDYLSAASQMTAEGFDPSAICDLAQQAGMTYVMVTTKHHDGFAMWDTTTTDFNVVTQTPFAQDPLKMLSEECAKRGLKLAFYFSIIDWTQHEAEPWENLNPIPETMMPYIHQQLRELLTNYGPIYELWFDMGQPTSEQSERLAQWVHHYQPQTTVVNSRVWNNKGDFEVGGDNAVPTTFHYGPWESILSLFPACWSYCTSSKADRSDSEILPKAAWAIKGLVTVISGGGQFAFNLGPKGDGSIDPFDTQVMNQIGQWMRRHPDAISGAHATYFPIDPSMRVTTNGHALFLFPTQWCDGGTLRLPGVANTVTAVYVDGPTLEGGAAGGGVWSTSGLLPQDEATRGEAGVPLPFTRDGLDLVVTMRGPQPDPLQPVIRVELDGEPGMITAHAAELCQGSGVIHEDQFIGLLSPDGSGGHNAIDAYVFERDGKAVEPCSVGRSLSLDFEFATPPDPGTLYALSVGEKRCVVSGAELCAGPVNVGEIQIAHAAVRIRLEYAQPDYFADVLDVRPVRVHIRHLPVSPPSAPVFSSHPCNVEAAVGGSAVMSGVATGYPRPHYQWFMRPPSKGREANSQSEAIALEGQTFSALNLPAVMPCDAGTTFFLEATNSAGTCRSEAATLSVSKAQAASYSEQSDEAHIVTPQSNCGWWQADLGCVIPVGQVRLWNRTVESPHAPVADANLMDMYVIASGEDLRAEAGELVACREHLGAGAEDHLNAAHLIESLSARTDATIIHVPGVMGCPTVLDFNGHAARYITLVHPHGQAFTLAAAEVASHDQRRVPPSISAIDFQSVEHTVTSAGDGSHRTITTPAQTMFRLSVHALGNPEPQITWMTRQRASDPWSDSDHRGEHLTVTITAEDCGRQYAAVATNEWGRSQSGIIHFTVRDM